MRYAVKKYIFGLTIWLVLVAQAVLAETPKFDIELRQAVAALPAVKGTPGVDLSVIKGQPVLVTFFASWCPPCLDEFAQLNSLSEKYKNTELKIIAINVYEKWDDNDEIRMAKFIETTGPRFPTVVGNESIRTQFGGISRIPTIYGFDKNGNRVFDFVHQRGSAKTHATFDELDKAAQKLIQ